jgi:hypothetical protein
MTDRARPHDAFSQCYSRAYMIDTPGWTERRTMSNLAEWGLSPDARLLPLVSPE